MFDIRRLAVEEERIELVGKSFHLNSHYYMIIEMVARIEEDQSDMCVYVPIIPNDRINQFHRDYNYWKIRTQLVEENMVDEIRILEHEMEIIPEIEPLMNDEFNYNEYNIPSYLWMVMTGMIVTII